MILPNLWFFTVRIPSIFLSWHPSVRSLFFCTLGTNLIPIFQWLIIHFCFSLFRSSNYTKLSLWEPYRADYCVILTCLYHVFSNSLLSDITRYSRFTLYSFSCSRPQEEPFSGFFQWGILEIRILELYVLIVTWVSLCLWTLQWMELEYVYIYII